MPWSELMRIVFGIEVGIEVNSYVQAGEILDKITRDLNESLGPKGSFDISNFRARHRAVHEFADQSMMAEMPQRMDEPKGY
jgi:5-carboxymethyl-2-hydroxymuconate isomerase